MTAKNTKTRARRAIIPSISDVEILAHPLLGAAQKKICMALRDRARKGRRPFAMLDFARIALRATAKSFTLEFGRDGLDGLDTLRCDEDMRRAAALYTLEELGDALSFVDPIGDGRLTRDLRMCGLLIAGQLNGEQGERRIGNARKARKRGAPTRKR